MACGCKVKSKATFADPQTSQVKQITADELVQKIKKVAEVQQLPAEPLVLPQTGNPYTKMASTIDVSQTTKPDQLCFNCIRKHLGMACLFLQNEDSMHRLSAVGELLCAVTHLKDSFPNMAYKVRDLAINLIRERNDISIKALVQELQTDPQQDIPQYIPLPSFPQEQQLLVILLVQSLLFIQLTYQEVNKTWATAQLSFFSYNDFRTSNSLKYYETYRPLWKLIQSMNFMDENYLAARDYIHSLLISKYPVYQQIILPRKKTQLEQDYKKQQELMQNLQNQKSLPQPS